MTTATRAVTVGDLDEFLARCQAVLDAYMAQHFPTLTRELLSYTAGPRYARIVKHTSGQHNGSAWAFIDLGTGDVLKCDGYKRPAKGVRGNLFDDQKGMGRIGPNGPGYNR